MMKCVLNLLVKIGVMPKLEVPHNTGDGLRMAFSLGAQKYGVLVAATLLNGPKRTRLWRLDLPQYNENFIAKYVIS